MSLIGLSSRLFDLAGATMIDVPNPGYGELRRRANRVATLDGVSVINDFGYTNADRTLTFNWEVSRDEDEVITRLVKVHQRVGVAVRGAFYEAIIDSYAIRNGTATLSLLVLDTLSDA